jgi:hypothetical protein
MACRACVPENQTQFDVEINVHFFSPERPGKARRAGIPKTPGLPRLSSQEVTLKETGMLLPGVGPST